ncbi:putative lipid-transfer protein DIR1 [Impatiens glandulifera]|uniref:putative lipid-transfer protein DIR1 n=1 Tax=Impatiens glandulifera TaxID=253017 RepID=UPI001FB07345|nr:putative lipid-transfer protein DIR1 [Impatiens glandulifera]
MKKFLKDTNTFSLVLLLVMVCLADQGESQTCSRSFFSTMIQLIPCRPAVVSFSPIGPSQACCQAVRTLGQPCLCFLVNGPPIYGFDRSMVLQLPEKCIVNFEPCNIGK